jgi:hypothetical protein
MTRILDPFTALAILGGVAALYAVAYGARVLGVDLIHGDWGPEWTEGEHDG